jgi:hypothetical protein
VKETKALTQRDLNLEECSDPNCTSNHSIIYLSRGCHSGAGLAASYNRQTGVLTVSCLVCDQELIGVEVAKGALLQ